METRNISLTLEKAREWYNSGSADLKEVALQAYTEEELTIPAWKNIKTFEDACRALNMPEKNALLVIQDISDTNSFVRNHLIAIYKLDIIRKALNSDWNPQMNEGTIYYPYIRYYPCGSKAEIAAYNNSWERKETFIADGKKYQLVGGGAYRCHSDGLGSFGYGFGAVSPVLGLLCCKSREIAEHISKYFAKEIFEACYIHHTGAYRFI